MKKFLWVTALLAALAVIVTGCPGTGDPEEIEPPTGNFKAAANAYFAGDGGNNGAFTKIQDANKPFALTEQYVRIIFDPLGEDFAKLRVKFTLSTASNISQQCAYVESGTWGHISNVNFYIDNTNVLIYERNPTAEFTTNWGADGDSLDKAALIGICFVIAEWQGVTLTLNEIGFVGVGEEAPPPESRDIQIHFKDTEKKATVANSDFAAVSGNTITAAWNKDGNDGKGEYRINVNISEPERVDLGSAYSKFVMDWTAGSANGGNFNVSLYFSGNRMLSAYAPSGTAEFNFIADNPGWAAGWGDAAVGIITGLEIWSDDSGSLGTSTVVITRLGFE